MLDRNIPFSTIAKEIEISSKMVRGVYIDINNNMRQWLNDHIFDSEFVFQKFQSVEIDEAYIKWTWHSTVTSMLLDPAEDEGDWILGMISRDRRKVWVYPIKDRTKENLIDPIIDITEKETTVQTDALSTYNLLDKDYIHFTINKKQEGFSQKDPSTGILKTVNHCECVWKHLRQLARDRHMNNPDDVVYICIEYMHKFYHRSIFDSIKVQ
jgi:hypothetical protein